MRSIYQYLYASLFGAVTIICQAATEVEQAKSVAWTTTNSNALLQIFKDQLAVNNFINTLYTADDSDFVPRVGEFLIADLHNDGNVELLATIAYTADREFYSTLYIINKVDGQFRKQEISVNASTLYDLKNHVVDLDGDSKQELLIPRAFDYIPSEAPIVNDVYAWDGSSYVESNHHFKDYFRYTLLPAAKSALANAQRAIPNHPHTLDLKHRLIAVHQAEIAAIENVINQ